MVFNMKSKLDEISVMYTLANLLQTETSLTSLQGLMALQTHLDILIHLLDVHRP